MCYFCSYINCKIRNFRFYAIINLSQHPQSVLEEDEAEEAAAESFVKLLVWGQVFFYF